MTTLISLPNNPLSQTIRDALNINGRLAWLGNEPVFHQALVLQTFMLDLESHLPWLSNDLGVDQEIQHEVSMMPLEHREAFEFIDAVGPANVFAVRVAGHPIELIVPTEGEKLVTLSEISEALSRMSIDVLQRIDRIKINPVNVPPLEGGHRVLASARRGEMTVYPTSHGIGAQEMTDILTHEVGHFVHFEIIDPMTDRWDWIQNLVGAEYNWNTWKDAASSDDLPVSRYANHNQLEDFAETYTLYQDTLGTPLFEEYRAIYPHRFDLMDQLLQP